jgi:hypothetical protein
MSRSDSRERRAELSPLVSRVIDLAFYAEEHDTSRSRDGEAAFFGSRGRAGAPERRISRRARA